MHLIWFILLLPVAGLIGYFLGGKKLCMLANSAALTLLLALIGWVGVLAVRGTELTETLYDRASHALGTVVMYSDLPLVQLMIGCLVVSTVSSWKIRRQKGIAEETETEEVPENSEVPSQLAVQSPSESIV